MNARKQRFLALSKKWSHDLANYGDLMMGEGGRGGNPESRKKKRWRAEQCDHRERKRRERETDMRGMEP